MRMVIAIVMLTVRFYHGDAPVLVVLSDERTSSLE